jgi:hypothetical protein
MRGSAGGSAAAVVAAPPRPHGRNGLRRGRTRYCPGGAAAVGPDRFDDARIARRRNGRLYVPDLRLLALVPRGHSGASGDARWCATAVLGTSTGRSVTRGAGADELTTGA